MIVLELVDAVRARHVTPEISIYYTVMAEPYFIGLLDFGACCEHNFRNITHSHLVNRLFLLPKHSTVINSSLIQNIDLCIVTAVHFTLVTQTHFWY